MRCGLGWVIHAERGAEVALAFFGQDNYDASASKTMHDPLTWCLASMFLGLNPKYYAAEQKLTSKIAGRWAVGLTPRSHVG